MACETNVPGNAPRIVLALPCLGILCVCIRVSASSTYMVIERMLSKLKSASSLSDLALLLNLKPGMLSYLLYKKQKNTLYKKFDIPKSHGGTREIWAPEKDLKLVQYRLSSLLQDCTDEINDELGLPKNGKNYGISHGFKRKHSIMTNARAHVTRRHVFNVDLSDFFGSLNFGRVRGFFLKDRNFLLHPAVATVLAQIACYENKLPQGSPCSPVISNLITHTLDILLVRMAVNTGCSYSRYADDLTFSSNMDAFPSQVAVKKLGDENEWLPGKELTRLVERSGFKFNEKKTRMQYRDSRQEVTGLVVNRKVNVPASYRYTARAMADSLFKTGRFDFIYKLKDASGAEVVTKKPGRVEQLLGMLSYIDQIDLFNKNLRIKNKLPPIPTDGRELLFRRLLYFNAFYAPDEPIIVCEGKTDNVYLKHAIKSLAIDYPSLVANNNDKSLKIRLFKYANRRTSVITELTGGVGGICNLIKNYQNDIEKKFKAPRPNHPIIVLIDNDAGAHSIYGAISGITKGKKPAGTKPFIHVFNNLYVVPTPFGLDGSQTMIEDFFDEDTLKTKLNGKTFDSKKDMDTEACYSKAAFARDVVARNSNLIDFTKFRLILDRVELAINAYKLVSKF
jgi:RNA-directed DNA polymerase